jgi:hypothetical protein
VADEQGSRLVVDVFPAYAPSGSGQQWLPAWGVALADGTLVVLTAAHGDIVDVLRPNG